MKRHIFITLLSFIILTSCYSQDSIIKISGEVIRAKITEVREFDFSYKYYDNLYGHNFKMQNREVLMIKNKEGYLDIFQNGKKIEVRKNVNKDSLFIVLKAEGDAFKYYRGYRPPVMITMIITSVGTPIIGVIPAKILTSNPPKDKNLICPDKELMKNPVYYNAYYQKANEIKYKKVWMGWKLGFIANIGLTVAFIMTGGFGSY